MRIALINEKGGTGKTTLAVHLAAWIAEREERRTLLVDLDPQGQVGKTLGFPARPEGGTIRDLFEDPKRRVSTLAQPTQIPNLDVIPADKGLAEAVPHAMDRPGSEQILARAFQRARSHETVVFDSPPSLGYLTRNILYATELVVLPVQLTYLALDGCAEIVQTLARVREETGSGTPRIGAIVPTFYRRTRMANEVLDRLWSYFPEWVTDPVGFAVAVDEAQSYGQTIWQYRPRSRAAEIFTRTCSQIMDRLGRA